MHICFMICFFTEISILRHIIYGEIGTIQRDKVFFNEIFLFFLGKEQIFSAMNTHAGFICI